MAAPDLRVGIDVGGTNTDAVALDRSDALLAKAKVPTTADVTGGITAALAEVLAQLGDERGRVTHVMLGTTHATNAILERRGLGRVALLRIGGPATYSIRPLFAWPHDLRETVSSEPVVVVNRVRRGVAGAQPEQDIRTALQRYAGVEDPTFIPLDVRGFDAAMAAGRSLLEAAPSSPARTPLRQLAARLAGVSMPAPRRRLLRR